MMRGVSLCPFSLCTLSCNH